MTISVAVMAHPSRAGMVEDLRSRLDRHAVVVWDRIGDRHDTGLRSLEAFDPEASHHLVIQDDALPCRDLVAGLERAVEAQPGPGPVVLYAGRARPFGRHISTAVRAVGGSPSWLTMKGVYWGPGILVPTADLPGLLDAYRASGITNYDRRVSSFYEERGLPAWYPWPSLVDHRDSESLVPGRGGGRHAHTFVGETASALDADWSGPVADLPTSDRADAYRQRLAPR